MLDRIIMIKQAVGPEGGGFRFSTHFCNGLLDVELGREYFNEVKTRIRQANQDDVNILFRHLFAIKVDLGTGEGQLSVLLGAEENDFVWRYRQSTRT